MNASKRCYGLPEGMERLKGLQPSAYPYTNELHNARTFDFLAVKLSSKYNTTVARNPISEAQKGGEWPPFAVIYAPAIFVSHTQG